MEIALIQYTFIELLDLLLVLNTTDNSRLPAPCLWQVICARSIRVDRKGCEKIFGGKHYTEQQQN